MNYLTPKKDIAEIARERSEQAERQNLDIYEVLAGLYEEIAGLEQRVAQLEGGQNQ